MRYLLFFQVPHTTQPTITAVAFVTEKMGVHVGKMSV